MKLVLGELLGLDGIVFIAALLEVFLGDVPLGGRLGSFQEDHGALGSGATHHNTWHIQGGIIINLGKTGTNPASP